MFHLFRRDAQRWLAIEPGSDPSTITALTIVRLLWRHMPLRAMLWFRLGSWLKWKRIPLLPGVIQRYLYRFFGLEIIVGAQIGGGLYIAHPIGTVIAAEKMGENCSIIASVTIGMRNEWAFPKIGDNVFIGAGARVLGDIYVGDDAVIGANAVVIKDVPKGATVVGIPAKVVRLAE
ncbi:MAG: serine acetyltransferase [Chloroflexota bacterium]